MPDLTSDLDDAIGREEHRQGLIAEPVRGHCRSCDERTCMHEQTVEINTFSGVVSTRCIRCPWTMAFDPNGRRHAPDAY